MLGCKALIGSVLSIKCWMPSQNIIKITWHNLSDDKTNHLIKKNYQINNQLNNKYKYNHFTQSVK